ALLKGLPFFIEYLSGNFSTSTTSCRPFELNLCIELPTKSTFLCFFKKYTCFSNLSFIKKSSASILAIYLSVDCFKHLFKEYKRLELFSFMINLILSG